MELDGHLCSEIEDIYFCKAHKEGTNYLFTEERIIFNPIYNKISKPDLLLNKLMNELKCSVCMNFLRDPYQCKSCSELTCQYCISNHVNY